jgi:2-methylcitrate dehydratase PrpD
MAGEIEQLAAFVAATRWEEIPPAVQHHAKLVVLDTVGVILAGSSRPEVAALRARLLGDSGGASAAARGATVFAPGWVRTDPRSAALLNGIAGRAIELCEGLRLVSGQAALQILPGALAVGEHAGRSGRELLAAFVAGYDVAARLAHGFTPRPLAHQNGQVSLLAAAAAGARLRGLDTAGISGAMRCAAVLMLTPSYQNAVAGATALNVAGGMSGFAAALAPDLAAAGFTARPDAIEEALADLVGDGFTAARLLDGLGSVWHITRNYFRLYACCNPIHPALDCLSAALAELSPRPEQIEHIEVATYRFAAVMRNPEPPNYFASKYSLPHAAAVMAVRGGAGFRELDDSALADPAIAELRQRVQIAEDPAMTALAPRLRPARVTLRLRDGRATTKACESHRGDFQQPFDEAEIRAKFRELAAVALGPAGAAAVERAIDAAAEWPECGALADALRAAGQG